MLGLKWNLSFPPPISHLTPKPVTLHISHTKVYSVHLGAYSYTDSDPCLLYYRIFFLLGMLLDHLKKNRELEM